MPTSVLILRITLAFLTLFLLTRIVGRKEIAQMTFFNFISAISIGTIGATLAIDRSLPIRDGVLALIGWTAFTLFLGWLNIKSDQARKIISGEPIIVIKDGKIMEDQLKKARLDIASLKGLLRENAVFAMADVDYAIFETDGKLSVMKKKVKQDLTVEMSGMRGVQRKIFPIPTSVISDGRALSANLEKLHLNEHWLDQQLRMAGIYATADVFYAEVQEDGTLYMDTKFDLH